MFYVSRFMKDRGFTILETTVAIFILVVALVAAISAFYGIMIATSSISSRLTAAYLAQEGIEIIRNIRDTNWLSDSDWESDFADCESQNGCQVDYTTGTGEIIPQPYTDSCLKIDLNNFYSYSGETPTKFKRKITITHPEEQSHILNVSVLVEWEEKGEQYNFTVEEQLYNWH